MCADTPVLHYLDLTYYLYSYEYNAQSPQQHQNLTLKYIVKSWPYPMALALHTYSKGKQAGAAISRGKDTMQIKSN